MTLSTNVFYIFRYSSLRTVKIFDEILARTSNKKKKERENVSNREIGLAVDGMLINSTRRQFVSATSYSYLLFQRSPVETNDDLLLFFLHRTPGNYPVAVGYEDTEFPIL
ncbi:hypothetical protein ANTQUA_LOCUS4904 [Anthophora quadrimaculata]